MKHIKLTQGKVALVDDDLYEYLNQWKWFARKNRIVYYAVRYPDIKMHRVVAELRGIPLGSDIDHRDGDGLNNQTYNLRASSPQQNAANRGPTCDNATGFKGVYWRRREQRWAASIKVGDKSKHLGYFDTALEAALAYDDAAKEAFGEFAYSNERNINE